MLRDARPDLQDERLHGLSFHFSASATSDQFLRFFGDDGTAIESDAQPT